MALINCSECGAEVSDKAAACPKCGNPIASANLKAATSPIASAQKSKQASRAGKKGFALVAFLGLLGLFMHYAGQESDGGASAAGGADSAQSRQSAPAPAPTAAQQAQSPTPESTQAKAPAPAPINISLEALPGWPHEQPKKVSLKTLTDDYSANEVSADNAYRGHLLEIEGVVQSISKDIEDATYLALAVDGHVLDVDATLNPRYVPLAARLSKGQKVTVICLGGGKTITPNLRNCAIGLVDGAPVAQPSATTDPGTAQTAATPDAPSPASD